MKIMFLAAYFEPENVASSQMSKNLLQAYADEGIEMLVYTPMPTRGVSEEIKKKYRGKKYEVKLDKKLVVNRFYAPDEGTGNLVRGIRYLYCNIIHILKGIMAKNIDIISVSSTPPTQGIVGAIVKKIKKIPMIYVLQDVFPDSLISAGLTVEGSFLWKIGRKIEDYTYRSADKIIVISEDFKKNIIKKGVQEDKIEVIYNWIDEESIVPIPRENNLLFDEFNLDKSKFYITYAGNLGNAQNIDIIIEAANKLKKYKDIMFIFFGKGCCEEECKKKVKKYDLKNVMFLPFQPSEKASQVYSLGNASIVSCKKGFGMSAMPSKTWSIMSAGTAIIANFDKNTEL